MSEPKYYYYGLGFHYDGPRVSSPDNNVNNHCASLHNIAADKWVDEIAKRAKIDMRHAYSWPDGSLYKYVRTTKPMTRSEFNEFFRTNTPVKIKFKKITVEVSVSVGSVTIEDEHRIAEDTFTSLKDKFELCPTQLSNLMAAREQERKACYNEYHKHRDACKECPDMGLPCPVGSDLFHAASATAKTWMANLNKPSGAASG